MDSPKSILLISAHAADFVWRAGGAIALYAQRGYRVRILCLSFGERGESERLWRQAGMTLECVKTSRRAESEKAAAILGAEIRFFDSGDYPLRPTDETVHEMVVEFRRLQPEFVLTHSLADPYNFDHPDAANLTLVAQLRHAVDNDELVLHYQPKMALADGRMEAVKGFAGRVGGRRRSQRAHTPE